MKKDRRLGNYMDVFFVFFLWLQKDDRCSDGEGAVLKVVIRRQREKCVPRRAEGKPKIRNFAMKREMPQCISCPSQVVAYAPNFIPRKPECGLKITGHNTLQSIGERKIVPEKNVVLGEVDTPINIFMLTSTSGYSRNSPILQEK